MPVHYLYWTKSECRKSKDSCFNQVAFKAFEYEQQQAMSSGSDLQNLFRKPVVTITEFTNASRVKQWIPTLIWITLLLMVPSICFHELKDTIICLEKSNRGRNKILQIQGLLVNRLLAKRKSKLLVSRHVIFYNTNFAGIMLKSVVNLKPQYWNWLNF